MNVTEAHDYLEDLQREFTKNRYAYSNELIEANGIAIQILENAEMYRWHNLPYDILPSSFCSVLTIHGDIDDNDYELMLFDPKYHKGGKSTHPQFYKPYIHEDLLFDDVLAWKYIEPNLTLGE